MNLVAKEYVASQDDNPGVVVLSRFCGAADTMKDALQVNPYDVEETARAINRGLRMPKKERLRRQLALMKDIRASGTRDWSDTFLSDLATPQAVTLVRG
jgi:trehalose 6-phosphate synthase